MRRKYIYIILIVTILLIGCHNHNYKQELIPPTCTEIGYTKYICSCGDSYQDNYINALGHSYGEWIQVKEATEFDEGIMKKVCSRCNEETTVNVPKTSHTHNYSMKIINPTCTEQGYTIYTCSCGDSYQDNYIDSLGHEKIIIKGIEATCLSIGMTDGVKCSRCNQILVAQEKIETLPHTEIIDEMLPSTCTSTGLTEGKHCEVCNTILIKQQEIAKKPHTFGEWNKIKDPTQNEEGSMIRNCTICDEVEYAIIPKLDHIHQYDITTISPTCTEKGYDLFVCSCGDKYQNNYTQPTGHSEIVVDKEATCTEAGYINCIKCSVCDIIISEPTPTSPLGHNPGDYEMDIEPTITTAGQKSKHCIRCEEKLDIEILPVISKSNFQFQLSQTKNSYIIIGYNDQENSIDIEIPQYWNTFPVISISDEAFKNCKNINKITIPDNISLLGTYIFSDCVNLKEINLPSNITIIGEGWFNNCTSLMTFKISNNITKIEKNAFKGCSNLIGITIPNTVTTIEEYAFADCSQLVGVALSKNMTKLSKGMFKNCTSLVEITNLDVIKEIDEEAFMECKALTSITLPSEMTEIKDNTFYNCSALTNIDFSSNLQIIGKNAFYGCGFTSIIISNNIIEIKDNAFANCKQLNFILISDSVQTMGKDIFINCDSSLIVMCQAKTQPQSWDKEWNSSNYKVQWNA